MGFWAILIAHITFCSPFVVVTVKARLSGLDPRLQEAAMDLYATPFQAFRSVVLPLVWPGILAGAPQVKAVASATFLISLVFVIAGQLRMRRRSDDRAATS
ncbi:ABC transporter permease subunit [Nocardia sp. 2]|uniref:ABC transporter permease subunit n=1 Tax=Nocardia acididurans TaxID=2802282 RepID=A0ABS1MDP9_9NOCA|nr:ABC transporter permease subunit [Nocardia acididurans]MBL1078704.1 ABC transporter permease subunit [Nocardia acididurans]